MIEVDIKTKKFTKAERSTFPYWKAHNHAFNKVAKACGCWHWTYIFHDFEKPWLRLFIDYKKVQKFHRSIANHHIEYVIKYWKRVTLNCDDDSIFYSMTHPKPNIEAMVIDWECSRFTKAAEPLDAVQEWERVKSERLPELFNYDTKLAIAFVKYLEPIMQNTFKDLHLK